MTHELKKIVQAYLVSKKSKRKSVLATVVALDGSSYRRPGVRMLIDEAGKMTGAVSGGCVEKEIWRQSDSVFKSGIAKVMQYDGRYRLGCEGVLYILIEPFNPGRPFLKEFTGCLEKRTDFTIQSYYSRKTETSPLFGTTIQFNNDSWLPFHESFKFNESLNNSNIYTFKQEMKPCFKLVIIGAEHDAVQLCVMATLLGWEIIIVAPVSEAKVIENFPGAHKLINTPAGEINTNSIDPQTAIILMTHNFVNDLKFLITLKEVKPAYIGILGPSKRREKLLQAFLEHYPEAEDAFFDLIHGPAGLNIGAETPQEIALSILSEILAVVRIQNPVSLKSKAGTIHSEVKW